MSSYWIHADPDAAEARAASARATASRLRTALAESQSSLHAAETTSTHLRQTVALRDTAIAHRDTAIAGLLRSHHRLQSNLHDRDGTIAELRGGIALNVALGATVRAALDEGHAALRDSRAALAEQRDVVGELRAANAALMDALEATGRLAREWDERLAAVTAELALERACKTALPAATDDEDEGRDDVGGGEEPYCVVM